MKRWVGGGGAGLLLLLSAGPLVYMGAISLAPAPEAIAGGFRPGLAHYRALLDGDLHFLDLLRNSLVVASASGALAVAIGSLAAYALTRLAVPGGRALLVALLAVSMFPQVSLVGALFEIMASLGWINSYAALIFPYTAWVLPLTVWVLTGYFAQIPRDLDRAAAVDGATRWQVLTRVVLPVAAPGIASAGLLAFIFAFNEFLFALMLTSDHRARTLPVGIALFEGVHGETPWGSVMAAATLAVLPVVLLALLFQRRIVAGLTRGALKG